MACVLSRASRSLELGTESAKQEAMMAHLVCAEVLVDVVGVGIVVGVVFMGIRVVFGVVGISCCCFCGGWSGCCYGCCGG